MNRTSQLSEAKYHFVGIGGIGMCGLAELLWRLGAKVSGSDVGENANVKRLQKLGVEVSIGHKQGLVENTDVVVYSSAISNDNIELVEAREKHIPIISRAEALAELMRLQRGIAIAGTHGKTTTTSLLSSILIQAQMDPTLVIGGRLHTLDSTARLGKGEWLLAEADESDGSFHKLFPEIAVITNIDTDHMDFYKTEEALWQAFAEFAEHIPFYGLVLVWGDDPELRELFSSFKKRVRFYGFNDDNDYQIDDNSNVKTVIDGELKTLGRLSVPIPGRHNRLNALAAAAVGLEVGMSFDLINQGLQSFKGVDRRFQHKGQGRGVDVYDDYAHHPVEIKATLQAFRERYPERSLKVFFQPHRFTRTQFCWEDLLESFSDADFLWVGDIYRASENEIPGVTSERLAKEIKGVSSSFIKDFSLEFDSIFEKLEAGDVFITLGAGDSYKLSDRMISALK